MSPDLIKRGDFRELYESADVETPDAPAPDQPEVPAAGRPRRFESHRVRFRELLDRLAEAEDHERRAVEKAAAEAREKALAEARDEYGTAADALRAVATELHEAIGNRVDNARDDLVDLAIAVASKVARREIRRDDEFVIRLIQRCLRGIVRRSTVRVRVNPDEYDLIAQHTEDLTEESGGVHHEISIVKDRRVGRGGCIVETPDFVVDGTIESQLATAKQVLEGDRA